MGCILLILFVTGVALALTSCVKAQKTKVPTYEQAKAIALKEGPLGRPPVEVRKEMKGCDAKGVAVKKGPGVPFTGVLIPPDKAACLKAQVAERDRLRTEAEGNELNHRVRRIISDAATKRLAEEVKRSWWERNQGAVLFGLGATIGAGVVIGLVYALTGGKAVSTQVHLLPPLQGARP